MKNEDKLCTGTEQNNSFGKIISSAQKLMIVNHYESLRSETKTIKHHDIMQHISKTFGISLDCVRRTISEYDKTKTVVSASRKRSRSENYGFIKNFDKNVLRNMVYSFWSNREVPTIEKLLSAFNGEESLPNITKRTLRTALNNLNFKCMKRNRNYILLERSSLVVWRSNYLSSIRKFRENNRPIYYLGETLFHPHDHKLLPSKSPQSGSTSLNNEGKRFIILHIGSSDGFVPEGFWCMETSKDSSNYRDEIKRRHFQKWFEKILPLLKDNAVIVLGNENYQSKKIEKIPTMEWRKRDIAEWLSLKGEEVDPGKQLLRFELMEIVKRIKPNFDKFVIDEIAKQNGKTVLRLPPFHSEFNTIELIWPLLKQHIMENNATVNIELLHQSVESFNSNHWQTCISHTIKAEQKLWDMDFICDELIDKLELSPSDESSGNDSSDFDNDKLFRL